MIWLAIAALALAALAPLLLILRRRTQARGAQAMALDLHRAQLGELDRDLAEHRILPAEHATAVLEVQRRLLAAAERPDATARTGSRAPLVLTLMFVPATALALYLVSGQPFLPSLPPEVTALRQQRAQQEAGLIAQLRSRLRSLDPATDQARQGFVLLGTAEEARGNDAAAADAFRTALAARFDPVLAIRAAEAATRAEGALSTESAGLLRQALAVAPADAPWRSAVEARLRQAGL